VRPSPPGDNEGKRLVVGREIVLTGEIRACDRLVVEGRVEAALTDSRSIEIAASGVFKGKAQIETAEISGHFEGDLVVTQKMTIHSTGRVFGNIRYGQIEIARGGVISGQIDVLAGSAAAPEAVAEHESAGGESSGVQSGAERN
jgi:cytoskeletal protein CcmA (bactofilin family)